MSNNEEIEQYIIVDIDERTYLFRKNNFHSSFYNAIPKFLRDPDCEEAKQTENQLLRLALKSGIRPFLPKILASMYGDNPPVVPKKVDILKWLIDLACGHLASQLAQTQWSIQSGLRESYGPGVYEVLTITSNAASQETKQTDHNQPV